MMLPTMRMSLSLSLPLKHYHFELALSTRITLSQLQRRSRHTVELIDAELNVMHLTTSSNWAVVFAC